MYINFVFSLSLSRYAETLSKIHVDPSTGHFMDAAGRVRMFRGINSVNKNPPYYFDVLLNKTIVQDLSAIGINIVRLGNMWDGWQPTGPETFNETYGSKLEVKVLDYISHISSQFLINIKVIYLYCFV